MEPIKEFFIVQECADYVLVGRARLLDGHLEVPSVGEVFAPYPSPVLCFVNPLLLPVF